MKTTRKLIGTVGVDSASVIVGDPINVSVNDPDDPQVMSDRIPDGQQWYWNGNSVICWSGEGDGEYPVYVDIDDATGRISRLTIDFAATVDCLWRDGIDTAIVEPKNDFGAPVVLGSE